MISGSLCMNPEQFKVKTEGWRGWLFEATFQFPTSTGNLEPFLWLLPRSKTNELEDTKSYQGCPNDERRKRNVIRWLKHIVSTRVFKSNEQRTKNKSLTGQPPQIVSFRTGIEHQNGTIGNSIAGIEGRTRKCCISRS